MNPPHSSAGCPADITLRVSPQELEQALRNIARDGSLLRDEGNRQIWRIVVAGKPLELRFYPGDSRWQRLLSKLRPSPAMSEFVRFQWLQKAQVPAPHGVAALMGLVLNGSKGDALLLERPEPAAPLDQHLHAPSRADHRALTLSLLQLLQNLGRAGLGHANLHPRHLLVHGGRVLLNEAVGLHKGNLWMKEILELSAALAPHASRTDLQRGWNTLGPGGRMPRDNARLGAHLRRQFRQLLAPPNVVPLQHDGWQGHCFCRTPCPRSWSHASSLQLDVRDWSQAFATLLQQLDSDQLESLRRGHSGDVLAGEIVLKGRPLSIVVKRPRRKYWWRYLTQLGRGSRSLRAWKMAWRLIARDIPTAWPLLLMERRTLGYATQSLLVMERIDGRVLCDPAWREQGAEAYRDLLFRCGRTLRLLDQSGLHLYDARTDNWMVRSDPERGLVPLIIDTDGLRRLNQGGGIRSLLRSLREDSDVPFDAGDERAVLLGYAPFADAAQRKRLGARQEGP